MNIKDPKKNSERYNDFSCMLIDGSGCLYAHGRCHNHVRRTARLQPLDNMITYGCRFAITRTAACVYGKINLAGLIYCTASGVIAYEVA